jgi:DNA-binding transcriptional MerR regulator
LTNRDDTDDPQLLDADWGSQPAQEAGEGRVRASGKSQSAFRTISEVSEDLGVPQHVLRFWESKFTQLRPLKRGGGRRYYRPEDLMLLRRIHDLLYKEGYTIKGVQRVLRVPRKAAGTPDAETVAAQKAEIADVPATAPATSEARTLEPLLKGLLSDLKSLRAMLD